MEWPGIGIRPSVMSGCTCVLWIINRMEIIYIYLVDFCVLHWNVGVLVLYLWPPGWCWLSTNMTGFTHTHTHTRARTHACTHTNTHTHRHTYTHRQTDRKTDTEIHRQADWHTYTYTHTHHRQTDTAFHTTHTHTQNIHKHTCRQTYRHIYTHKNLHALPPTLNTHTHTHTHSRTQTQTDRQTDKLTHTQIEEETIWHYRNFFRTAIAWKSDRVTDLFKAPFTLTDCDCKSDIVRKWVVRSLMYLLNWPTANIKEKSPFSLSKSVSVNEPQGFLVRNLGSKKKCSDTNRLRRYKYSSITRPLCAPWHDSFCRFFFFRIQVLKFIQLSMEWNINYTPCRKSTDFWLVHTPCRKNTHFWLVRKYFCNGCLREIFFNHTLDREFRLFHEIANVDFKCTLEFFLNVLTEFTEQNICH